MKYSTVRFKEMVIRMTTKDYLNQLRNMKNAIIRSQERIDEKRSMLTSISVKTSDERVQSSSNPDKMAMMISDILDSEAELQVYIRDCMQKEREISQQIESIEDWRYREILYWRYVIGEPFEKIAVNRMNLTFRHVMRLHKQALKVFEEKYRNYY